MLLVAALALAFAVGTGQHFTTFGLYVVGAVFVAVADQRLPLRATRCVTGIAAARGRRAPRSLLVGDDEARAHLRASLGSSRGGIDYDFVGEVEPGSDVEDGARRAARSTS